MFKLENNKSYLTLYIKLSISDRCLLVTSVIGLFSCGSLYHHLIESNKKEKNIRKWRTGYAMLSTRI